MSHIYSFFQVSRLKYIQPASLYQFGHYWNRPKRKMKNVIFFIPASSPLTSFNTLNLNFLSSAQRKYILKSIPAQSQASVPPAPEFISTIALALSNFPEKRIANLNFSQASLSFSASDKISGTNSLSCKEKSSFKSLSLIFRLSQSSTLPLISLSSAMTTEAAFESPQKLGSEIFNCSLWIC